MNRVLRRPSEIACWLAALLAIAVVALPAATAQQPGAPPAPLSFVPRQDLVRLCVHDLPVLLEQAAATPLGALFAEPDVQAAFATGAANYHKKVQRWLDLAAAAQRLDASLLDEDALLQQALYSQDWRDFRSLQLFAVPSDDGDARIPRTVLLLQPRTEAQGRLQQRLDQLIAALGKRPDLQRAEEQKVDGHPALVLEPKEGEHDGTFPGGLWLLQLPGLLAYGSGAPDAGHCVPVPPPPPGLELAIDLQAYFEMASGLVDMEEGMRAVLQAIGFDPAPRLEWTVRVADGLVQDDIALRLPGRAGGLLGALLEGTAPLVAQPLPEGVLLQLRCAFDVPQLLSAADVMLQVAGLPTCAQLGIVEDLRRAFTGGVAFGLCQPARGGLVPRLYLSFGIADAAAAERLLDRLGGIEGMELKDLPLGGRRGRQLRIEGAPAALQPSFCLDAGALHCAESGPALRALLQAAAGGGAAALDVGDAPLPKAPGTPLPTFDLRFDGAAIHRALHEIWLPLWRTTAGIQRTDAFDNTPLLDANDMPDLDSVLPHLRRGRGVLRRQQDRVVLSMSGTAGGPELHALLSAYGPMLSGDMTSSWSWTCRHLSREIATQQLTRIHAALAAFERRTGKRPAALGELLASKDLADAALLLVPDDDKAEAVLHEGAEVGRTSFRYYPQGLQIEPEGQAIDALLIELRPMSYQRLVLDRGGSVHQLWGDSSSLSIEEFEKAAKDRAK